MAKTEKELQELKEKVEALDRELKELTEEELNQIAGGNTARPFSTESGALWPGF